MINGQRTKGERYAGENYCRVILRFREFLAARGIGFQSGMRKAIYAAMKEPGKQLGPPKRKTPKTLKPAAILERGSA